MLLRFGKELYLRYFYKPVILEHENESFDA
jgi:hypothetical protein